MARILPYPRAFLVGFRLSVLLVGITVGLAKGQQLSVGLPSFPISISVSPSGEISISSGGTTLLEGGRIYLARSGAQAPWEPVSKFKASVLESGRIGAILLTYTPSSGIPVRFFIRASSGNALAGPVSLATDASRDLVCRFEARVRWGIDPWLVQLGQTAWESEPAERLSSIPSAARPMLGSMVSVSPPGFVSQPKNAQVFQAAAGAVEDRNSDTLYDPANDRALIFHGRHVELTPMRREDRSEYLVRAELDPGDEATQVPLAIAGRWFAERLNYQVWHRDPAPLPRLLLLVVPMPRVINTQMPFFRPMPAEMRANFPQAPSGWLPVYTTLPRTDTAEERERTRRRSANYESLVVGGAKWFARNLRPDAYGRSAIIGFQGWGERDKPIADRTISDLCFSRDWRTYTRVVYPHGPKWMSDELHRLGFRLGSWFVPQAWDTDDLYNEHRDWFLHYPDGRPIQGDYWLGKYMIDASNPAAREFVAGVVRRVADEWGIDDLWLDGFWSNLMEGLYASAAPYFHDPTLPEWEACRELVRSIRRAVRPAHYISFDGPLMTLGLGLLNGSRTAADPNSGGLFNLDGAITALTGTMDYYFLNSTGMYCDPDDAFSVGEPLTLEQGRLWAGMVSLTGQYVMTGDAVWDLAPERVSILKAVFPSPPVRPVELYSRHGQQPAVWDIRIAHVGHQWDVVMFANWEAQPRTISVNLDELGLNPGDKYLMFDFWERKSLGIVTNGRIELLVPATGSRLVRLTRLEGHPQLFGLTRHATQGLVDLRSLAWEERSKLLRGESIVPGGDPYQFWVAVPEGYSFRSVLSSAGQARCEKADSEVLACSISSADTQTVTWTLQF